MTVDRPLIVGNWKMRLSLSEALVLAESIKEGVADLAGVDVVLCPPFPFLGPIADALSRQPIAHLFLGAQNIFWQAEGAYTGEVAAPMLHGLADFVILGHSERRRVFHETDAEIAVKVKLAVKHGLRPILCVGEIRKPSPSLLAEPTELSTRQLAQPLNELEAVVNQLSAEDQKQLIVAYEPIWAISTGAGAEAANGHYANAVCFHLRQGLPDATPVLYGGSVEPANAREFLAQPEINGVLVGGASLLARSFVAISKAAL